MTQPSQGLRGRLACWRRLDGARRALVVEAAWRLVLAWLALKLLPFRVVARHLGSARPAASAARARSHLQGPPQAGTRQLARDIGWAVTRTAAHLPCRAVCLHQALAARQMLQRRGIRSALYFGVAKLAHGSALEAHAWLDTADTRVTGAQGAERFVEVACFF